MRVRFERTDGGLNAIGGFTDRPNNPLWQRTTTNAYGCHGFTRQGSHGSRFMYAPRFRRHLGAIALTPLPPSAPGITERRMSEVRSLVLGHAKTPLTKARARWQAMTEADRKRE